MVAWKEGAFVLAIVLFCSVGTWAQSNLDPHRRACADSACRAARAYIKAHYCGESPYGNGPDDGCDIIPAKHLSAGTTSVAKYDCKLDQKADKPSCRQVRSLPPECLSALLDQMHQLGLPMRDDKKVLFSDLASTTAGWSVTEAYYQQVSGNNLTLCQFIAVIGPDKKMHSLHKVRLQTTDFDKVLVTTWSPIDIATMSGKPAFILEGDAYENRWFEAIGIVNGEPTTIFSGLGYYL